MDSVGVSLFLDLIKILGLPGVVVLFWYFDNRFQQKLLATYREDTLKMQAQYQARFAEILAAHEQRMMGMQQMYENNAELVRRFIELSSDVKEVLIMNTQAWQRCIDAVNNNQFCPNVRLKKDALGRQEG